MLGTRLGNAGCAFMNPSTRLKSAPFFEAVSRKDVADIVVRCLDPYYSQGKFTTKELFKSFARHLSHLLAEGRGQGRDRVKADARSLIKTFFSGVKRCEREEDWRHLQGPYHTHPS